MAVIAHDPSLPTQTHGEVTRDVLATITSKPTKGYYILLGTMAFLTAVLLGTVTLLLKEGLGLAGYAPPIMWSVYITTFVFWVGIGHAGTLISAILFLFRSPWRTAVYRATEAMTVFAVMTAALFPIIHIGRQWIFYWLIPYPNARYLWPNFKSPLLWDVFAISTYLTVSSTFLMVGLVPDIAAVRDHVSGWRKKLYGALALGWTGADSQWRHYSRAYLYLAALATPLVLSVHSVVSWDFAVSIVPGWHGTIFAPYFVAGAIYSGIGMVLTLMIPLRKVLKVEHMITDYHFDNLSKLTLFTGTILFYAYAMEYFVAWYSGSTFEQVTFWRRAFGPAWWAGWTMIICNAFVSQLLWFKKIRTNLTSLFIISIFINLGMWFERYVIVTSSLSNDYVPYAWGQMNPTWADWLVLLGSFGWFGLWFTLFYKNFPIVAIQEIKEMIPMPRRKASSHGGAH
ncbi:MAG: polysulfide reductase NrfD [Gemmatimonadetes bacterium]|jgi:molybdopterin-containing oxidoreductase family membrane subunit|nr:polysulfide reductase NrfD [Gemmatimonadota bacterium]MBK9549916.1 polysulfide reductase NrfD [Gemmatimonadota bacterium]MBP6443233.1 polysulfide reductase NrfD [Gemmatimonadales bacterium]MBP6570016.1 polysulfide reductase NrfD [Gemmatimonadales bacterium]MBP9897232.1 polysulfide reductase NrfD [Gemmatimonadales bacterium]